MAALLVRVRVRVRARARVRVRIWVRDRVRARGRDRVRVRVRVRVEQRAVGLEQQRATDLPYISAISPLHLPYISAISPHGVGRAARNRRPRSSARPGWN